MYTPSIYNNQVYAPSIDEIVLSFPENHQYFCQYATDIDNIIDRVRSAIEEARQPRSSHKEKPGRMESVIGAENHIGASDNPKLLWKPRRVEPICSN